MTPERIKEIEKLISQHENGAEYCNGIGEDGHATLHEMTAAALKELLEERKWRSIETAPINKPILLHVRGKGWVVGDIPSGDDLAEQWYNTWQSSYGFFDSIDGWLPLPESPKLSAPKVQD